MVFGKSKSEFMILKKLNAIKDALLEVSEPIKGTDILRILESKLADRIPQSALYDLINDNVIIVKTTSVDIASYTFEINKAKASDLEVLEHSLENYMNPLIQNQDKLVWSYPRDIGLEKIKGAVQLYPELCSLISSSKESIFIVNPFFDFGGVENIAPYLDSALDRGVRIRMITSKPLTAINLKDEDDPFSYMISSLKSKRSKNLAVKSFYGNQGTLTYSTHAKFMIFDNKCAYLGSANLTRRSLSANVELGIIAFDSKVKTLVEIFGRIWNLGSEIKL